MISVDNEGPHQSSDTAMPEADRPAVLQTGGTLHSNRLQDCNGHVAHRADTAVEGNVPQEVEFTERQEVLISKAASQQGAEVQAAPLNVIQPSTAPVRRFKGVPYMPDTGSVSLLTNMGFGNDQAVRALKVTQGNIERAANWLLSGL